MHLVTAGIALPVRKRTGSYGLLRSPMKTHSPSRALCHCLKVEEAEIIDSIAITGAATIRDVMEQTGAGSGCTACHCRIRELIGCRAGRNVAVVPAG
ncbi:MAG: (2Fe-2S)-binding protein [Planctomycetota bacterium]|nr:MAG: (2Fe-2S)-binding protein [Planctomycetota bacterium]REJ92243.1 MAG: (2Fe-2S)-binding protein [Planctomycetota bacterium]REK27356.1 MAG: (2Fe-2S)-binding protein [Planctomycetota bacterium]REK36622.1 MAG: (2Fe-2S)-binding protein [Planctomycetota bacterium]